MLQRWFPRAALLVVTVIFLELVLEGAARISPNVRYLLAPPWVRDAATLRHPTLGYVGNPVKIDHDRNGYRNPEVPGAADIVVLGDSQCYGMGVGRSAAWPSVLARRSGLAVYNMGLAGYSAANALLLLERALQFRPRFVLAAVYFGNDLYDAFALARTNPTVRRLIPQALASRAEALERRDPLIYGFGRLFGDDAQGAVPSAPKNRLRLLLSEHSALYALLRAFRFALDPPPAAGVLSRDFASAVAALSPEQREWFSPFDAGDGWRTILTGRYRAQLVDLEDPRVAAGFEVVVGSLIELERALRAQDRQLVALIIPTKELAFASRVSDPRAHVGLTALVHGAQEARQRLRARLAAAGVPVVDLLEPLRASAESPYFEDADGHLNERGHEIIAEAVIGRLRPGAGPAD